MTRFLLMTCAVLLASSAGGHVNAREDRAPNRAEVSASHSLASEHDYTCPKGAFTHEQAPNDVPAALRTQARVDQCFVSQAVPAVTETYQDTVIITPAQTTQRVIPAVTTKRVQKILVTPARQAREVVPAVTHIVRENVMVTPATTREETVPAEFRIETQRVLVKPARTEWDVSKRDFGGSRDAIVTPHDYQSVDIYAAGKSLIPGQATASADKGTLGETESTSPDFIYTLKEYPAEYEERQIRVLLRPETTRKVIVPAVVQSRERVVIDTPSREVVHNIPAEYREAVEEVVSEPERTETVVLPAVVKTVEKQRIVKPAQTLWTLVAAVPTAPAPIAERPTSPADVSTQPLQQLVARAAPERPSATTHRPAEPQTSTALASTPVSTPAAPAPSPRLDSKTGKFQYKLGPGDKLRVLVFGEPDLTGEFVVSGDGRVSIPLIGEVPAVGLTSPELQESIRTALSPAYLQDARVNVEVLTFRPFYILGEVNKPGEYPFTNGLTVSKAVATASGYTYRANAKKFYVKRDGEDKERLIDSSSNAVIGPGDVIRIPERYF